MEGPVFITNTHSVGVVRDAAIAWSVKQGPHVPAVVAAGRRRDLRRQAQRHQRLSREARARVRRARRRGRRARRRGQRRRRHRHDLLRVQGRHRHRVAPPAGAGRAATPSACSCRRTTAARPELRIAGVPVGREIPVAETARRRRSPARGRGAGLHHHRRGDRRAAAAAPARSGSRAARRIGLARTGGVGGNGSGDIFLAFSTANDGVASAAREIAREHAARTTRISALFSATVEATEEAIVNALVAAETMTGIDGRQVPAISHDRLRAVLTQYGRR